MKAQCFQFHFLFAPFLIFSGRVFQARSDQQKTPRILCEGFRLAAHTAKSLPIAGAGIGTFSRFRASGCRAVNGPDPSRHSRYFIDFAFLSETRAQTYARRMRGQPEICGASSPVRKKELSLARIALRLYRVLLR
jgi:hypothetical protein